MPKSKLCYKKEDIVGGTGKNPPARISGKRPLVRSYWRKVIELDTLHCSSKFDLKLRFASTMYMTMEKLCEIHFKSLGYKSSFRTTRNKEE